MAQKRLGRPPVAPDKARPHRLVTFVGNDELARIRALAERQQTSISKACNRLIRQGLRECRCMDEPE